MRERGVVIDEHRYFLREPFVCDRPPRVLFDHPAITGPPSGTIPLDVNKKLSTTTTI
jgi:hypothetical protein